jgi:NTE family protein
MDHSELFLSIEPFRKIPHEDIADIANSLVRRDVERGSTLIEQGQPSDSMFVVISGRFTVHLEGTRDVVAEIGVGEPIGEIGFFAEMPRSATVIAARDSAVLQLDKSSFDKIASKSPSVYHSILRTMARRLAETTSQVPAVGPQRAVRTVAIVGAGDQVPAAFLDNFQRVLSHRRRVLVLSSQDIFRRFPKTDIGDYRVTHWLNTQEAAHDFVIYTADLDLTEWSRKVGRQSDQVLIVSSHDEPRPLSQVEMFMFNIHPPSHRRLVRLHSRRRGAVEGTAAWLLGREVSTYHHIALTDDDDLKSLCRFLTDSAIGFVAGSGGALGAAHIGIFQAFEEHGIKFDVVGGASVGAAVTAAWAFLSSAKELHAAADDIFVRTRSFNRITYPRYSMLDHTTFDEVLKRQYRGYNIEDVWRNYFALSSDLSLNTAHMHRSGPLWRAVRASSSLPGFLPPVYEKGHMLVDGALIDKVPLAMMHQIKSGPNVVVHFGLHVTELFKVEYESIPGRWRLLAGLLSPLHRKRLPVAPGPANVLLRSLFANQRRDLLRTGPHDLIIEPPTFPGSCFWDWSKHEQISEFAYNWAKGHINELVAEGNSAFAALIEASASN